MDPAYVEKPDGRQNIIVNTAQECKGPVEGLMQEARTAQLEVELSVKEQELQSLKAGTSSPAPPECGPEIDPGLHAKLNLISPDI